MKSLLIVSLVTIVLIAGCIGQTGEGEVIDSWFPGITESSRPSGGYESVDIHVITDNAQDYNGKQVSVSGFFNPNARFNYLGERVDSMVITGQYDRELWVENVPAGTYSSGNYEINGTIESREYCTCQFQNMEIWTDFKVDTSEFCTQYNLKTDIEYRCDPASYRYVAFIDADSLAKK